jgi:dienelactone hydrolase
MRAIFLAVLFAAGAALQSRAQPHVEPHVEMVEGIKRYLLRATGDSVARRSPNREHLRKMLGLVDLRTPFTDVELLADSSHPALLFQAPAFEVYAVRWPVLEGVTAEGLWFKPRGKVVARVVAIPDADQLPEQFRVNRILAASGCEVLSPVLIDRRHSFSGNPKVRMTTQPHREFVYRMAFEVGRHPLGYEIQKVLAAVDWFSAQPTSLPVGVWGYGEGGAIALFAAALDDRITAAGVSGFFAPREGVWKEPVERNVFGLLKDFGDAEIAAMISPRAVVIDTTPGPTWTAAPKNATPGVLAPASNADVEREFQRARVLYKGSKLVLSGDGLSEFLRDLGALKHEATAPDLPQRDSAARQHRQFDEMVQFTQRLARDSHLIRESGTLPSQRTRLWDDVIGRLPASTIPLNARQKQSYEGTDWTGYEVTYDVLPDVIGYGVLLLPKDIKPGERRPVVVAQHGLEGRPQDLFLQPENDRNMSFHYYQNIGTRLTAKGYVVYLPQNPYIGDFRKIQRLANPLGLSLFSFILAQHDRLLDWLSGLPYVDPSRIGFYGLSYGGKTALRVPALLDRYAFSICSGDFNEWVHKVTTVDDANSYMYNQEYEMPEFDLASVANHAEMAMMIAPRPFMVERGHRDGVGLDEWVAFEYAKVKRYYDEQGIGDRCEIEFFNGPHMIHGVGTLEFIRKHFGR